MESDVIELRVSCDSEKLRDPDTIADYLNMISKHGYAGTLKVCEKVGNIKRQLL